MVSSFLDKTQNNGSLDVGFGGLNAIGTGLLIQFKLYAYSSLLSGKLLFRPV